MRPLLPVLLLAASNAFMTVAWYGHLRFKDTPLWLVIAASWLVALPEYCLQVPANRWGHGAYSAAELLTIAEVLRLLVFCAFSVAYLGEALTWRTLLGFALVASGAFVIFQR